MARKTVWKDLDDLPNESARIYTDEEIAEFLEADKLDPELARWVRERYPSAFERMDRL